MIHSFTIFCKLNQISFSDRQWFELESGNLSHTDGVCPVCHAKACLSPFAFYTRYLVEWKGGAPVTHEITVQRYQCSSCGHTHALLSSALVQAICEQAGISVSTLYRWKSLFLAHKALWLGVLKDLEASGESFLDGLDGALLKGFSLKFLFSFLQRPRSTVTDLPSGTPGQTSGFT